MGHAGELQDVRLQLAGRLVAQGAATVAYEGPIKTLALFSCSQRSGGMRTGTDGDGACAPKPVHKGASASRETPAADGSTADATEGATERHLGPYDTDVFLTAISSMHDSDSDDSSGGEDASAPATAAEDRGPQTPWFDAHRPPPAVSAAQKSCVREDIARMRKADPILRAAYEPLAPPSPARLHELSRPRSPRMPGCAELDATPRVDGIDPSLALQDTRDLALYSVLKATSIARKRQKEETAARHEERVRSRRVAALLPWRQHKQMAAQVEAARAEATARANAAIAKRLSATLSRRAPARLAAYAAKRREQLAKAEQLRTTTNNFDRGPERLSSRTHR